MTRILSPGFFYQSLISTTSDLPAIQQRQQSRQVPGQALIRLLGARAVGQALHVLTVLMSQAVGAPCPLAHTSSSQWTGDTARAYRGPQGHTRG